MFYYLMYRRHLDLRCMVIRETNLQSIGHFVADRPIVIHRLAGKSFHHTLVKKKVDMKSTGQPVQAGCGE